MSGRTQLPVSLIFSIRSRRLVFAASSSGSARVSMSAMPAMSSFSCRHISNRMYPPMLHPAKIAFGILRFFMVLRISVAQAAIVIGSEGSRIEAP